MAGADDADPEKGVSAAEITNRWAMEKMMVNRAIQRLVDNGCITRQRDPNDRRRYRLALTTKGRKLYDKIALTTNKRYNELMSAIDSDETTPWSARFRRSFSGRKLN